VSEELAFHPLADIFPLMEGAEFDAFVADVKANGLLEDIILHEGKILEGRNRYRACLAAGRPPYFQDFSAVAGISDPTTFVISRNIHRRHLTAEQKREIIAKLVAAQPEKSDRAIAEQTKSSPQTVGRVRATVPGGTVEKRVGKDGKARRQPATKAKKAKLPLGSEPTPADTRALIYRRLVDGLAPILASPKGRVLSDDFLRDIFEEFLTKRREVLSRSTEPAA
jgi:hypothetical protein